MTLTLPLGVVERGRAACWLQKPLIGPAVDDSYVALVCRGGGVKRRGVTLSGDERSGVNIVGFHAVSGSICWDVVCGGAAVQHFANCGINKLVELRALYYGSVP